MVWFLQACLLYNLNSQNLSCLVAFYNIYLSRTTFLQERIVIFHPFLWLVRSGDNCCWICFRRGGKESPARGHFLHVLPPLRLGAPSCRCQVLHPAGLLAHPSLWWEVRFHGWSSFFWFVDHFRELWHFSVRQVNQALITIFNNPKWKLAIKGCCFFFFLNILFIETFLFALDGKVYDAYVLYPKSNGGRSFYHLETFVSTILPDVLEQQCGYNLFILGRDDLLGEGML